MDKLAAIRTFIKVAEMGKFSRAADALGIPPPRATQRVRDLENALQVRLLDRTTKSLVLTREGQEYFDTCRRLLKELDAAEDTLHGQAIGATGNLRVEAISSIGRRVLAPRLHEFKRANPGIHVALGCSDRVAPLAGSGIDCFLRGGSLEDSSYIAKRLCLIHFGVYGAPEHARGIQSPADLERAKKIGVFRSHPESSEPWELQAGDHMAQIQPAWDIVFDDAEAAITAAAHGAGIVVAPVFLAAEQVAAGHLVPVLPMWSAGAKPLYALFPSTRHTPHRLRCFLDWVEDALHTHPHLTSQPHQLACH